MKTTDFVAADGIVGPIYIIFFYVVMIFTLVWLGRLFFDNEEEKGFVL